MQVLQNIKSHNQMQLLQTLFIFKYYNKTILTNFFCNFHQMMEAVDIIKLKNNCTIFFICI
jgi:hypothetical protein